MIEYFQTLALILFVYMNFWFVVALILKRNDVADIAWGLGFVLLSWTAYYLSPEKNTVGLLVNVLVTAWGLRLAYHIFKRLISKTEDSRYAAWREEWGKYVFIRSYLQVFILQGIFLFLIVLQVLALNSVPGNLSLVSILGLAIWLVGYYFEVVGDKQLKDFVSDKKNKGKIMQSGLWKYSRHPNYFGEVTMWWGIFVLSYSVTQNLLLLVSPLTITFLILFVSGVPLLEKKYNGRPDFEEYKKKTSVFFPLPQKKL